MFFKQEIGLKKFFMINRENNIFWDNLTYLFCFVKIDIINIT